MKTTTFAVRFLPSISLFLVTAVLGFAQVTMPQPVLEGETENDKRTRLTGLIDATFSWGSGAVAEHPRVVLSCAHVIFDTYFARWLSGARWFRGWNDGNAPDKAQGQVLNGYFYWRPYAAASRVAERARRWWWLPGGWKKIAKEFDLDAVAYFSYSDDLGGGEYSRTFADGAPWLNTSYLEKWVTGYPSGRYEEGNPLEFRQHLTGGFYPALWREWRGAPSYLTLDDTVETGSGNSGGPVWLRDPDNNEDYMIAGVLVSGAEQAESGISSIGVRATSQRSYKLILDAMRTADEGYGEVTQEREFISGTVEVPDAVSRVLKGKVRKIPGEIKQSVYFTGMPPTLNGAQIDLLIEHEERRDLLIMIQPPKQRKYPVFDGWYEDPGSEDVSLSGEEVPYFYGINPNGRWTLRVLDMESGGDTGRIVSARIRVKSR